MGISEGNAKIFMSADTSASIETKEPKRQIAIVTWLRRWRWFSVFVLLPVLFAGIYYGFIASDIYVSESRFVIKSPDRRQSSMSTLAGLIQTTGLSAGHEQTNEVMDYLRSRDALRELASKDNVRQIFMSDNADVLSRYPRPFRQDNFENLYSYYRSMVNVHLDTETGTAVLTVKSFDPSHSRIINERLLQLSEALVNRLNARSNSRTIAEAEGRVQVAEARVRNARLALSQFRNRAEILDPQQQGAGILQVTNALVAQQTALQARLAQLLRAAPSHPSIASLRQRIDALGTQIASQTGRAVGTPTALASKLSAYENLMVEQEFATNMLTAANASLEQSRAEALKQQYYLERVVEANKPDYPLLPARWKSLLTVLFASLCLYLVGWMLVVGILEHAPED